MSEVEEGATSVAEVVRRKKVMVVVVVVGVSG